MLKNIKLHLEQDDEKQAELEREFGQRLSKNHADSINAFERFMPNVVPFAKDLKSANIDVFVNKDGEYNIVDYGLGRTLYGLKPLAEIEKQIELYGQCPTYITCNSFKHEQNSSVTINSGSETIKDSRLALPPLLASEITNPLVNDIHCLVMLGCGLGYQIQSIIESRTIKYLIIYEPELQYFRCSTMVANWKRILDLSKQKGTALFLQLGKDGRDIVADIEQLKTITEVEGFYLYQHYRHPVFNSLTKELQTKTWASIVENGISFKMQENYLEYTPRWTAPIAHQDIKPLSEDNEKLLSSLHALKKYFPALYEEFADYTPNIWLPVAMPNGEINLIKRDDYSNWYGDSPRNESLLQYRNFKEQPNKDGLVLGYTGKKLAHYIHYRFVKETEKLLKDIEDAKGVLPDTIESIIFFGLGSGYQLETACENHKIENLFVCEPNRDFFFASLFAIDWQAILENAEKNQTRVYLNIGDDGTNLMKDLLKQFYSIGPSILANSYFYQSYYNSSLVDAIAQLREQLKIVIAMGEYFDHAYFGIAHTTETIKRGYHFLRKSPEQHLPYTAREVPVFLIGNGPSLDQSIEAIKEIQDKAILVSCGTSLQVLWKHGIRPDFHAEIEQNRSTFYWSTVIGDFDYLKEISLISCNGIHPDTCELFKDVYITFKDGESSTVAALNLLGEDKFQILSFAFPTVSNFASNLFAVLGFHNIYFIGIDLGFIDNKKHHSKYSAYYKDDFEEVFDFAAENNTSLVVPGNFRKTVYTKHEFKVAKELLEQSIHKKHKLTNFFNCSDGARIQGAHPLGLEQILITSNEKEKEAAIQLVCTAAFVSPDGEAYSKTFDSTFKPEVVTKQMDKLIAEFHLGRTSSKAFKKHISDLKEYLFLSYQTGSSLLFYYLFGTLNYANSVLAKLINSGGSEEEKVESANKLMAMIQPYLKEMYELISFPKMENDSTWPTVDGVKIINNTVKKKTKEKKCLLISDSQDFHNAHRVISSHNPVWDTSNIDYCDSQVSITAQGYDYVIYFFSNEDKYGLSPLSPENVKQRGKLGTLILFPEYIDLKAIDEFRQLGPDVMLVLANCDEKCKLWWAELLFFATQAHFLMTETNAYSVVIPAYQIASHDEQEELLELKRKTAHFYNQFYASFEHGNYIGLTIDTEDALASTRLIHGRPGRRFGERKVEDFFCAVGEKQFQHMHENCTRFRETGDL